MGFVLGISGPAGSGKDTVADYLIETHGWDGKLSFARNLKNMCKAVFKMSEWQVSSQEGKRATFGKPIVFTEGHLGSVLFWMSQTHANFPIAAGAKEKVKALVGRELRTPREILQMIGTDICRSLISSYHLDIVWKDAAADGNWVVTDVRFPNEAEMLANDLKGSVIKVFRPQASSCEGETKTHLSEVALSSWSGFSDTIDNSIEGLENLYKEVNSFLERNNLPCRAPNTQSKKDDVVESTSPSKEEEIRKDL